MKQFLIFGLVFGCFLSLAVDASAVTLTGKATGRFGDVVTANPSQRVFLDNVDDTSFSSIGWGFSSCTDCSETSKSLSFDGNGSDVNWGGGFSVGDDEAFLLGSMWYYNQDTSSDNVLSASLKITLNMEGLGAQTLVLPFSIDQAAETVTLLPSNTSLFFQVGTDMYSFDLFGFSTDGGQTFISNLSTPYNQYLEGGLYGRFSWSHTVSEGCDGATAAGFASSNCGTEVPEPASAFLLIAGLPFLRRIRFL